MNPNFAVEEYSIARELKALVRVLWILLLSMLGFNAHAQTYDLTLNMGAYQFSGEVGPAVNVTGSGFDFTAGGQGYLIDLEGAPSLQAAGSEVWTLQYYTTGTVITGALLNIDGQMGASCGSVPGWSPPPGVPSYNCTGSVVDPPTKAPEMDMLVAITSVTLLLGCVAILKGKS
jgi:hypothetical protein